MQTLLIIPWAFATVLLSSFFAAGALGWPGEFVGAGALFCEAFSDTWIKQPANTWSNLGFVAAGLWMVSYTSIGRGNSWIVDNIFTKSQSLPMLYALLVIFIGPGSMALHGTGHAWGHTLDVLAMFTFIMFPIAWTVTHLIRGEERAFWVIYLSLTIPLTFAHVFGVLPFSGIVLYAVLIPTTIALEVARYFLRPTGRRSIALMVCAIGSFALAFLAWRLSLTGAPLCDPRSLVQGHALWHLLCAGATVWLFLAYTSEKSKDEAYST